MRQLFDLLRLLDGIDRHHALVGLGQVLFQFLRELSHLFRIAPDLDLALLIGSDGLLTLDIISVCDWRLSGALRLRDGGRDMRHLRRCNRGRAQHHKENNYQPNQPGHGEPPGGSHGDATPCAESLRALWREWSGETIGFRAGEQWSVGRSPPEESKSPL